MVPRNRYQKKAPFSEPTSVLFSFIFSAQACKCALAWQWTAHLIDKARIKQIGAEDDDECEYCNMAPHTMYHSIWKCEHFRA